MWVNPGLSISTIIIDVSARHYGYNLINAAGLPNGTLHPMLVRLQVSAWSPRNGNLPAGRQQQQAREYTSSPTTASASPGASSAQSVGVPSERRMMNPCIIGHTILDCLASPAVAKKVLPVVNEDAVAALGLGIMSGGVGGGGA